MQATETAWGDVADVVGIQAPGGRKQAKNGKGAKPGQKMGLVRKPSLNSRTIASWVPSVVKFHGDSLPGLWVTCFHAWKWPSLRCKVSVWGSFSFPFWDQEKDTPSRYLPPQAKYMPLRSWDYLQHTKYTNLLVCSLSSGKRLFLSLKGTEQFLKAARDTPQRE